VPPRSTFSLARAAVDLFYLATMQDPSNGIHRDLVSYPLNPDLRQCFLLNSNASAQLPHIHLLSTYRFPHIPATLHPEKVAEWLLGAPKITRDQAPFYWTYLDRPGDGSIFLVWQSMAMGAEYPSDGYIWAPAETAVQYDISSGYTLEMYQQKIGYAPNEPVATHSRRRYRLMPKFTNPSGPQPDPSLWIIHYSQCDPTDRVPANVIPIDIRIQNIIQTRAYLHQQGQIVQKEFMLHDRANWPQISFPRGHPRARQPLYGETVPPSRITQAMAYPPHQAAAGPPAKRPRTQANIPPNVPPGGVAAPHDIDDDEDTSRGDLFDHFTPREISHLRYKQNHEWMEEILSSPYSLNQIIPVNLRLGLRGELANLTEGIFDAPLDPEKDVVKHSYVGQLDPEKADEFRKRANEHVAQANKDMEKLKAKHEKRMAKFKKGALVTLAEKELRTAVSNPSDTGPEYWRLEGKVDEDEDEIDITTTKTPSKVDEILAQVEASLGRHAVAVQELCRIQDGGYEEPAPLPPSQPAPDKSTLSSLHATPQSGILVNDVDMEMGNSAAGLLDQYNTGLSSNATPGSNFGPSPQPNLQAQSAGTPGLPVPSPQPVSQTSPQPQVPGQGQSSTSNQQVATNDSTGDWVVIPPGGVSPVTAAPVPVATTGAAPISTTASTSAMPTVSPLPTVTSGSTPLANFATSPNDFADLGDLDTAGEALAGYEEMGGSGDLDLDMDVGMDDSAFGEAFHGVEPRVEGEDSGEHEM
jgi:hypothetical protein